MGYESEIFVEDFKGNDESRPISALDSAFDDPHNVLLFHFSIGSEFPYRFVRARCRKIVRYHNITPAEFFAAPDEAIPFHVCNLGRKQIPMLAGLSDALIADSEYNAQEFTRIYPIESHVVPVLRDYDSLMSEASDPETINSIKACGKQILLFVGRIAPNKAQHDLLKLLALYRQSVDPKVALILVGGFFSQRFRQEIVDYAKYLGLTICEHVEGLKYADVCIPGSISDASMAGIYRSADLFVSMSEHEGFGVPLVEAMYFEIPTMAHAAAAVPETLGDSAVLFEKSDWVSAVAIMKGLLNNKEWQAELRSRQRLRRVNLGFDSGRARLEKAIETIIGNS